MENVPIERLQAFYHRWYQPDTATLIVSGRIDPAAVQQINASFGKIRDRRACCRRCTPSNPPRTANARWTCAAPATCAW
jgi:zinc protease